MLDKHIAGCLVAAPLAKAPYIKTCVESCKCAFISWFIPFFAIYAPGLLLLPADATTTVLDVLAILISLFILQSTMAAHYFWNPLPMPIRVLHFVDGILLLVFVFFDHTVLFLVGAVLGILLTVINKKAPPAAPPSAAGGAES